MPNDVDLKALVDALTERVSKLEDKADGFTEGHHALDKGNAAISSAIERNQVEVEHVKAAAADNKADLKRIDGKLDDLTQRVVNFQSRDMWKPVALLVGIVITIAIFFVSYTHDAVGDVEQEVFELRQELKENR